MQGASVRGEKGKDEKVKVFCVNDDQVFSYEIGETHSFTLHLFTLSPLHLFTLSPSSTSLMLLL